jgi:amino acid transporter
MFSILSHSLQELKDARRKGVKMGCFEYTVTAVKRRCMANPLFERKPLALLLEEMKGENRLRRILGPVTLTSLGVGAIIGTGIFVSVMAGFLPLRILAELTNIGTLLAFVIVCSSVLIMRYTNPEAARPFRAPFVPLVPILGILSCLLLMFSLPPENWCRLIIWLVVGFIIYFSYGRRHSVLAKMREKQPGDHGL